MRLTEQQRALVEANLGLVATHLKRWVTVPRQPRRQCEYDDLFQEGCVALVRAAARYDPCTDGPFVTYALRRIRSAVGRALYEGFATVRVPMRALRCAAKGIESDSPPPGRNGSDGLRPIGCSLDALPDIPARTPPQPSSRPVVRRTDQADTKHQPADPPTLGLRIRQRHRAAVWRAVAQLLASGKKHRGRDQLLARLAGERLLIPQPEARVPLRQIAREAGCSIGRVVAWEQRLTAQVRQVLQDDEEFQQLLRLARRASDGFEATIDADMEASLARAVVCRFERAFADLALPRQAEVLLKLLTEVGVPVRRTAVRLFRRLDPERRRELLASMLSPNGPAAGNQQGPPDEHEHKPYRQALRQASATEVSERRGSAKGGA